MKYTCVMIGEAAGCAALEPDETLADVLCDRPEPEGLEAEPPLDAFDVPPQPARPVNATAPLAMAPIFIKGLLVMCSIRIPFNRSMSRAPNNPARRTSLRCCYASESVISTASPANTSLSISGVASSMLPSGV